MGGGAGSVWGGSSFLRKPTTNRSYPLLSVGGLLKKEQFIRIVNSVLIRSSGGGRDVPILGI